MALRYTMFLRTISLALVIIAAGSSGYSCGPELGNDATMFLLFQRNMPQDRAFTPFYYAQKYLYDITPDPQHTDQARNCAEWQAVTGSNVRIKDIRLVQYSVSPSAFLKAYRTNSWTSLEGNTFIKWLLKPRNADKLEYFAFAKQAEAICGTDIDDWDRYEKMAKYNFEELANTARQRVTATSGFLQQRYAFQAMKLMYYNRFYGADSPAKANPYLGELERYYKKYLSGRQTVAADWALSYYAADLETADRQGAMLKAFHRTDEKKVQAYLDLPASQLPALLRRLKSPQLREACYALMALKTPGRAIDLVKNVYALNPESHYLPILISREVNKLEDWIWSPQMRGFQSQIREYTDTAYSDSWKADDAMTRKNRAKDEVYLEQVRQAIMDMAAAKQKDKDFMQLTLVHLYHLQGRFADAQPILQQLGSMRNADYAIQLQVEKALSATFMQDITSNETKATLNAILGKLEKMCVADTLDDQNVDDYSYDAPGQLNIPRQLYLLLSHEYRKKNDVVTAALLLRKAHLTVNEYYSYIEPGKDTDWVSSYYSYIGYLDKYGTPADVDAMLALKHKQNKTAFERRLAPTVWPPDDVYRDLKGTLQLRLEDYKAALATFSSMDPGFWENTYEFAAYLRKSNVTDVGTLLPVASGLGKSYRRESKLAIVRDIVTLQDSLARSTSPKVKAQVSMLLGNAYYNISYSGKDWMLYAYGKTSGESEGSKSFWQYNFYTTHPQQYANYYRCSRAKEMYRKALAFAAGDKELSGQILLMLAVCDKANYFYKDPDAYWQEKVYYSPYIGTFRKQCTGTNIYRLAASECPDVAHYGRKRKSK